MAQESSYSRDNVSQDEVVLKIRDEDGNHFDSQRQIDDTSRIWSREFSGGKSCWQSSCTGGIQESMDDDDDDEEEEEEEEEEDDDDDLSSDALLPRKPKMFMSRAKSRLEDRHWRYERAAETDKKGKDQDSFMDDDDDDRVEEFDWTDTALTIVEKVSLLLILVTLICTLTISALKKRKLWELRLWKWEILILVLICGRLVSGWIIRVVVLDIEGHFLRNTRVLYFVYGLKKPIQNFLWLGQVLLVWHFILAEEIGKKVTKNGVVRIVTKILVCLWVGTLIWLLKTLIVKVLALSFHVRAFFDRIRESLFKQFVIKKLSGFPIVEEQSEGEEDERLVPEMKNPKLSRRMSKPQGHRITIERLQKLNKKNVSVSRLEKLMSIVQNRHLLSTLDEDLPTSTDEDEAALRIRDECDAKVAAKKIFQNVAEPGSKHIRLTDLKRFMSEADSLKTMHLLKGANQNQGINKHSFTKWMVDAFKERMSLALSLDDTKTAVDELHNLLNVLVAIVTVIIWLFIFEIAISHFIVLVGSQLLLTAFIFGDTCKRIFEAITFLFVMHPFDVGDQCEIDGEQMVVEEMNILTTVFLRHDNQMIIYPNSVLAMKPITNYFRSPDVGDAVDFSIHISTPMEKVTMMKKRIIRYVERRKDHWHQPASVFITNMEDMNRLKMVVGVKHRLNNQNVGERLARRALLVEKMIGVFRELNIEYRMLPLDVNVLNMPSMTSNRLPSNWTTCSL